MGRRRGFRDAAVDLGRLDPLGQEREGRRRIVAGINAARACGGAAPFRVDRATAYIGVMIDDLVTLGTAEPYRMFTSRADYRLLLRADNADQRLTGLGIGAGCVGPSRRAAFERKLAALLEARKMLSALKATPTTLRNHDLPAARDGAARTAVELLSYPGVDLARLGRLWPELANIPTVIAEQLEIDGQYAGYLERQEADIKAFRREEELAIPTSIDFASIGGLSAEARTKLAATRPATLGAASRIPGLTPAALVALLRHVQR